VSRRLGNAQRGGYDREQDPLAGSARLLRPGQRGAPLGTLSWADPFVTAGGLVLIARHSDPFIRAFDVVTGKKFWKAQLPASGHATPMTYRLSAQGKQYVVIAAGGHAKITEEPLNDALVAFALP